MPELRLPLTLRARMVAIASIVVTAVLLAGGLLLGTALHRSLVDDLAQASVLRARDLAALASSGALPRRLAVEDDDEALVQVLAGDEVVAASGDHVGLPPVDVARPPVGDTTVTRFSALPIDDDDDDDGFVVAATTVAAPRGPVTVLVAASLEDVTETTARAAALGLLALPATVLALSGAMWFIVGRTLAPVEAISAEAEAISGQGVHRRLPEPVRQDEIGRLARPLNAMLQRLEDASTRQRRFVADAAHELRSPIASLRAQLEVAASRRQPDGGGAYDGLLAETLRMQELTEQLLLLARADAGAVPLRRRAVDLDDLVDIVTARYREDPRVRIDRSELAPVQVSGDPVLLKQVVGNLVDNAHRHARTRVAIGLRWRNGVAVLTVDVDGSGIAPADRAAVFERFTRLDVARDRDHGGAGLGLAIVADIVRVHGGRVVATSSALGGARLEVVLPA